MSNTKNIVIDDINAQKMNEICSVNGLDQKKHSSSFFNKLWTKFLNLRKSPFSDSDFLYGGAGSGECIYHNKKGQESVRIELFHLINPDYSLGMRLNDSVEPVSYDEVRIWCLCDKTFWYAIEFEKEYYAFDIRPLFTKIGFGNPVDEMMDINMNKRKWLLSFIKRLESSSYYIDVEYWVRLEKALL